jgi:hypothetical protein
MVRKHALAIDDPLEELVAALPAAPGLHMLTGLAFIELRHEHGVSFTQTVRGPGTARGNVGGTAGGTPPDPEERRRNDEGPGR